MNIVDKPSENIVRFIYMGKTFENCIHEAVKSRFNMESACYLSVCLRMCSQLRIYKTKVWYWCGAYSKDKYYTLL